MSKCSDDLLIDCDGVLFVWNRGQVGDGKYELSKDVHEVIEEDPEHHECHCVWHQTKRKVLIHAREVGLDIETEAENQKHWHNNVCSKVEKYAHGSIEAEDARSDSDLDCRQHARVRNSLQIALNHLIVSHEQVLFVEIF